MHHVKLRSMFIKGQEIQRSTFIGGLMFDMMDSGSKGLGLSPAAGSLYLTLNVPPSTQEYKWVPANCQGNLTKCWW